MQYISYIRVGLLALLGLLSFQASVCAEPDARMQVNVAAQAHDVEVRWLHANIRKAADLALPELWNRIVPQHARTMIPKHVKAVRFLQKAVPTELGVSIIFNEKRVLRYLKQNNIPYYAEQSANQLTEPDIILPTPDHQISPLVDNQPGLPSQASPAPLQIGLLTVQRQASLPEQVLFEDDLSRDPRISSLTLRQVNRGAQQYRLQLKSRDDLWLTEWFRRRGMILTQSVEGWVAQLAN